MERLIFKDSQIKNAQSGHQYQTIGIMRIQHKRSQH